jgi:hypothetical protein
MLRQKYCLIKLSKRPSLYQNSLLKKHLYSSYQMKFKTDKVIQFIAGLSFCIFSQIPVNAQLLPVAPEVGISVNKVQDLNFGAFAQTGHQGTITISADGSRTVSGGIVTLNTGTPFHQAIFDIQAPAGTIISVMDGFPMILSGSNGGTMLLRIHNTKPASPFITQTSGITQVSVGGTLTVNSSLLNVAGNYNGPFTVIFINQ